MIHSTKKNDSMPHETQDISFSKNITSCQCCGTCCTKGGPSFHYEDIGLIEDGIIPARYLFTIRHGELTYNNIKKELEPASSDIIKIKGTQDSWTCIFLNSNEKKCQIYQNRPAECRVLKCWDTHEIEILYTKNRLTRKDLLSKMDDLWDLIEDHDQRCSYHKIGSLAGKLNGETSKKAAEEIIQIVSYDKHIRTLILKNTDIKADMLDFLFGRPLSVTIKMFGLKIRRDAGKNRLVFTS